MGQKTLKVEKIVPEDGTLLVRGRLIADSIGDAGSPWETATGTDIKYIDGKVAIGIDQPKSTLHVNGNVYASSNLEVGSANFYVDTANSRVGIGTRSPGYTLDVDGDINISTGSQLRINGTPAVFSNWETFGSDIYRLSRVGVGTGTPTSNLHVVGNVYASSNLEVGQANLYVNTDTSRVGVGTRAPNSNLHVEGNAYVSSNFEVGSAKLFVDTANTRVGVGKGTPGYTLDVDGDINISAGSQLRVDGTPAVFSNWEVSGSDIYRLSRVGVGASSIDANLHVEGNAYVSSDLEVGSANLYVDTTNSRVGVGTTTPDSNLHVEGNVNVSNELSLGSGLIMNRDQVVKKTYSFSGSITQGAQPTIGINFTSNIFYSRITAQLVDGDEELSTMILEISGGSKSGTTPSTVISVGVKSVFGSTSNPNPWDEASVATTSNRVSMQPFTTIGATGGGEYHIFVEYTSPVSDGQVTSIDENTTDVFTFNY
jgi:hypothetical protein